MCLNEEYIAFAQSIFRFRRVYVMTKCLYKKDIQFPEKARLGPGLIVNIVLNTYDVYLIVYISKYNNVIISK